MIEICICACTYRRPDGLATLLNGLGRQQFSAVQRPQINIVIADNEGSAEVRAICERFRECSGLPLSYVHEPRRGISFARNACLDYIPPECEFFAFIDDDEVPDPDWLERLMEAQQATSADVVQGPVIPHYQPGAPQWLVEGEFIGVPRRNWSGKKPQLQDLQDLPEAYTGNVLVRKSFVEETGTRFDPAFGLTGGGDALFFRTLKARGARIVFASRALVYENIPASRASFWSCVKREYRVGNSVLSRKIKPKKRKIHLHVRYMWRGGGLQKLFSGVFGFCLDVATGRLTVDRAVVLSLRCAYGLGQCTRFLGFSYRPYQ